MWRGVSHAATTRGAYPRQRFICLAATSLASIPGKPASRHARATACDLIAKVALDPVRIDDRGYYVHCRCREQIVDGDSGMAVESTASANAEAFVFVSLDGNVAPLSAVSHDYQALISRWDGDEGGVGQRRLPFP